MLASLALRNGVVYVGRFESGARVRPFDLEGRPLSPGFAIRAPRGERARPVALDVDPDHHVWVADAATSTIRRFTLFGREVARWGSPQDSDARGSLANLVDLEVDERDGRVEVLAASGGWRRHAVQLFDDVGRSLASLRSEGDPRASFQGVSRVARRGERIYVCELHAGRVQVFRGGEFEFLFRIPLAHGARFEPVACAPLDDGRLVVANGGDASALLLVDRGGRLLRVLAERGRAEAQVLDPTDVAACDAAGDRSPCVVVVDQGGERVQVLGLEGEAAGGMLATFPGE